MSEVKPGQVYAKDGKDFCVHEIKDGQIYGCLYDSENRGNLNPDKHWYGLRRVIEKDFVKNTGAVLVEGPTTHDAKL